jgi:4-diphosphocytidyl-2-C-methyl-D-erythritol kinase
MLLFPHAKINLGLYILQKREDGYHELETVFYPVRHLKDILEVVNNRDPHPVSDLIFTTSGLMIEGSSDQNLCIKAYSILKRDFPDLPAISMHLHKHIPMGAGLGGGSSDGAYTLRLLNQKFNLQLSNEQLLNYALQLGSDCPFFIFDQPCIGKGRGEILQPIDFSLDDYQIILVHPGIHVSTSEAFKKLNRTKEYQDQREEISDILKLPIADWRNKLINDFQETVCLLHPEIDTIIQQFYKKGALYASLSGSGSAVYGIFEKNVNPVLDFPISYFSISNISPTH